MAFSKVYSGAIVGLDAEPVWVEVNIDYQGFPGFTIVGLASREIDEAKERVRSAIKNSGYQFVSRRITVNLAPADLPKRGSIYDLPIAIGILASSGVITKDLDNCFVFGELSLDGKVTAASGAIPLAVYSKNKFKYLCLPYKNAKEVSIIDGLKIKGIKDLRQFVRFVNDEEGVSDYPHRKLTEVIETYKTHTEATIDLKYIKGQALAKRALEVAAAGGHNLSLVGSPGSGKTLLSKALPGILPSLNEDEIFEVTKIYSVSGKLNKSEPFVIKRPFRSPHHSISKAGLLGGGTPITPGEISYAHRGVLFIDEFSELDRNVIESLRQPIESGEITISRASGSIVFPASFMLVIASNPCPCGYLGHPKKECKCYPYQIKKYQEKLSGPLIDRIDLHVNCFPVKIKRLTNSESKEESTEEVKSRVQKARHIQNRRYKNDPHTKSNAELSPETITKYCQLDDETSKFLSRAATSLYFSARTYHKIIKVSRTIADLNGERKIEKRHIAEAVQYRHTGFMQ